MVFELPAFLVYDKNYEALSINIFVRLRENFAVEKAKNILVLEEVQISDK